MSHFKQFSYPDISRRWMILSALFLTFFSLIILLLDASFVLKQYFPYYPIIRIILFITLFSFLSGNIIGKIIYSSIRNFRLISIAASVLFFLTIFFYFFKTALLGENFSHFNLYVNSKFFTSLIFIIPSFISGILNCYFIKISTGDFIDEKNLLSEYILTFFLAISTGTVLSIITHLLYPEKYYFSAIVVIITFTIIILTIFLNIPFTPEALIAQHYPDDDLIELETQVHRDDLFYTYMNFSYITIYLYLGLKAFNKFFGDIYYYNFTYLSVIIFALIIGMLIGSLKRISSWHVYSEMLFPIFFLSYLFLLYNYENKIEPVIGLLFLILPVLVFGFSLKQTTLNILYNYSASSIFRYLYFQSRLLQQHHWYLIQIYLFLSSYMLLHY